MPLSSHRDRGILSGSGVSCAADDGLTDPVRQDVYKRQAGDSREQGSLFADIFQAAVENVKETEQVKNDAEYRLATGQMDNPAEMSIASSQWSMSVNLLIQLRNKALDAYNELMRISL